ncbi:hypothetical protein IFM89_014516 [Coptis chinensis]|uniref:Symplekin n=1 Tax=Coptis chinensis TaxID=261450 RepID=A0A835HEL2_9MAGN|nr:hypothetical protein IFM89_014516 [Coptis chinensis]
MVGMMSARTREEVSNLLHSINFSMDNFTKLENFDQLKEILLERDPSLIPDFLPQFIELQNDSFRPIRKSLAGMIGEIGMMDIELIPEMMPVLLSLLKDDTPAVARQAIISGTSLYRGVLEKVAVQGLHSSGLDESVELSWDWMLKFKDTLYQIAFQAGSDGIRLLALKFVEAVILLYSPDPESSSEPQPQEAGGKTAGFDISWLRGGHPLLNAGDLSVEASQSLGLLLDQLRFPKVKSLSNSMIVVLIKSLSAIAKKRPAFYGRILPVLLGLDPPVSVIKGICITGVQHTLRNAFLSCLKCTNPGAAPWRERLVGALEEIKNGELAERARIASRRTEDEMGEAYPVKEEKPFMDACDAEVDTKRKRSLVQDIGGVFQENGFSVKRARPTPLVSETSDGVMGPDSSQSGLPAVVSTSSSAKGDTARQLAAMFGALVAQGEKAVGSLEILISSISADLLAEVVMANLQYLPVIRPNAEEDGQSAFMSSHSSSGGFDIHAIQSSSLASEVASLFSAFPQIASLIGGQPTTSHDAPKQSLGTEQPAMTLSDVSAVSGSIHTVIEATETLASRGVSPPSSIDVPSDLTIGSSDMLLDTRDEETLECGIPGLDTIHTDGPSESLNVSHLASAVSPGLDQDITSVDALVSVSSSSLQADRSEELSPKATVSDANSVASTTTTPVVLSNQCALPKMTAPVVILSDDQKDDLQRMAFMRIIDNYNKISVAGGSHLRFSLLACLGVEYPLELDPWKLLQKHILSDYVNHEGHELTTLVLYRLFREAEQEHDFFSSTTATSVYESFLLVVAETLRDSFPASDKSLSRLLGEVPYIPKSAFKLLESLCCPETIEKVDKELQNGDRVTQGLSAVWSLILLRPPIRDVCVKIALQSAVHHMEEVRMKAIRLVANKLYPIIGITRQIEDFATEMLLSVMKSRETEGMDVEQSTMEVQKGSDVENSTNEELIPITAPKEVSFDTRQSCSPPSTSSSAISEAETNVFIFCPLHQAYIVHFLLQKHSLFREIFVIYSNIPEAVKEAVHRQIPILVRTIGTSSELLAIISDPPTGSESLLIQVLNILTDGTIPSPDLVSTVRRLYDSKLKDVDILIPVLSFLPKDEVFSIFPQFVNLPTDKFQDCLVRLLQRQVFTQQVLAKVLNQLVEQIPLPLLFMRTVLQAIGAFPALVDFIMEILSRLVTKQIWKYPKLWVGFLKCVLLTKPQSFSVLLQLPAAQLENALNRTAALKPPLIAHASQPNIRSALPRSTLVVLGIASDSQASSQAQPTPTHTAENSTSGTEVTTEKTKESSTAS